MMACKNETGPIKDGPKSCVRRASTSVVPFSFPCKKVEATIIHQPTLFYGCELGVLAMQFSLRSGRKILRFTCSSQPSAHACTCTTDSCSDLCQPGHMVVSTPI